MVFEIFRVIFGEFGLRYILAARTYMLGFT